MSSTRSSACCTSRSPASPSGAVTGTRFADARVEGFRRAQHRFIVSGASGKVRRLGDSAQHFTLSVIFVPPGQGKRPRTTHEVEEVFFIPRGQVLVFIEDGAGGRAETVLGRGTASRAPLNVIPRLPERGARAAYLQVMLGKAKPTS
jgi:mannose-6-phosphate isomerase-like protein (cupin superfamily)